MCVTCVIDLREIGGIEHGDPFARVQAASSASAKHAASRHDRFRSSLCVAYPSSYSAATANALAGFIEWRGVRRLNAANGVGRFALTAQVEPRFSERVRAALGQHAVHQRVIFGTRRADEGERRGPSPNSNSRQPSRLTR
jgi:hypothetical protein